MHNQKLTKEQIKSIKNYGSEISTLDSFVSAVREMPGMYIGHKGIRGFLNMFREVFQNSIDELMRDNSPCDTIIITFDEASCTVIVEDNGKGIPFNNIVRIFTKQHTSVNYKKELYNYTSGRHGVGAKVTNALSTKFIVESYVLGEARRVEFNDGIPWDKGDKNSKELNIPNKDNRQGSMICFTPSFEIMGDIDCTTDDILGMIKSIVPLTKLGSKVLFNGIKRNGFEEKHVVINEVGPIVFINETLTKPIINPIIFGDDNGTTRANVYMTFDSDNVTLPEYIRTFSNFSPTDSKESSHIRGFIAGLRRFFVNYMNKIYLNTGKKKTLVVNESDIRTGLRVVVDVAHLEPNFTGQAKEVLSNDDMEAFVRELTYNSLDQWSKDNPADLQKICKYFKDIAELRIKSDTSRIKLSNQYNASVSGKPTKYVEPVLMGKAKGRNAKFELYLVEGDSAGGSIKSNKNNDIQGLFPLRGKILNCFGKDIKTCLKNAEVAGILSIIDAGYGKSFDINKVVWDKIVIATDADADGDHIANLLIRMFLVFCPQLILAGKLYRVIPPLYSVGKGKNTKYFATKLDYVNFIQKEFSKKFKISTLNSDKNLTSKEVVELLFNNIDYLYELRKIGDRYKVDYKLLELYLFNRNESVDKIGKLIEKDYRFMKIASINKTPTAEGIIDNKYNTLFMNNRLLEDSKDFLDILSKNIYYKYRLNGEEATLYDIMSAYEKTEPSHITRFKGLGEMEPEELGTTTVLPAEDGGSRFLIQYTMEDVLAEIETIRALESDKAKLMEGVIISRAELLG